MAVSLANYAMDHCRRIIVTMATGEAGPGIGRGVHQHLEGDTTRWNEGRGAGDKANAARGQAGFRQALEAGYGTSVGCSTR